MAVCALQAALSLPLVWGNSAFSDEAEFLWGGHLEVAHWLHGTAVPSTLTINFFGSPVLYPPLGAVADSIGGVYAARILALAFLVGATALLYAVASQLFGPATATVASVIWVSSEPVIRCGAFATCDAPATFLLALSAWLAVLASFRFHRGELIAASAASLALASATAYASVAVAPAAAAFAFLTWRRFLGMRQAWQCAAWLCGAYLVAFALVMTWSRSWVAIFHVNQLVTRVSATAVAGAIWAYFGGYLILVLAGIAVAVLRRGGRSALLAALGCSAFITPALHLADGTTVSLDQHLLPGMWFGAMTAGHGLVNIGRSLPNKRRAMVATVMVACCGIAVAYLAANSWQHALNKQLGWANSRFFVTSLRPVVARQHGLIDVVKQNYVAMYYTPQGMDWRTWSSGAVPATNLVLRPPGARGSWPSYYTGQLAKADYGVVALFYTATVSQERGAVTLPSGSTVSRAELLAIASFDSRDPTGATAGLRALTAAIEHDPALSIAAVGHYSSHDVPGIYVIWQRRQSQ